MYITRERFEEICKKKNILSPFDKATASIDSLNDAAREVYELCGELMNEELGSV